MIEVESLIEKWTQEERAAIYGALEKLNIGCFKLDADKIVGLRFKAQIEAKSTACVVSRSFFTLKPNKLVILEPTFEQIEHEQVLTAAKIEKTWWRTRIIEPQKIATIEHKRFITVPRSTWRLRGAFVGADVQFPMETDIPGDLFGPDSQLRLTSDCMGGIDVTLQIENITSQAMPFYAVLLGERREDRPVGEGLRKATFEELSGEGEPS